MTGQDWLERTSTPFSASQKTRATQTSKRPTGNSHANTTPTTTKGTPPQNPDSKKLGKPTLCCPMRNNANSTMRSDPWVAAVDSLAAPVAGSKTSSPPCSVMAKATDLEQGHEGSAPTPTSTTSSLACSVADSVADKPVPDQDLAPDSAPTPQAQDKTLTRPRRCRSEAR